MKTQLTFFLSACVFTLEILNAQECPLVSLTEVNSFESICLFENTPTAKADALNRPYLYVASMEGGFKVVSLDDAPELLVTIETSEFGNLQVTNLSQVEEFVYLTIGHQPLIGTSEGGMAIIDVSDPEAAFLTDFYIVPGSTSGAGIVEVKDGHAFLGAMGDGVVVLDVSDVSDIQFVSQFIPDVNFPEENPTADDLLKINARGMAIENNILYLCYDAGGFRTIDISDVNNLVPMDEYSNPELMNLPRAYNNVVLDDGYAFVTADYCGLEVIDISDPNNITLASWWNPWDCTGNVLNWWSSPGHTNEIVMDKECDVLFMASGKSDMHVVDVSDPLQPDSCSIFGGADNEIGTWGISMRGDSLFLGYICTFGVPFASTWTGIKIIEIETDCANRVAEMNEPVILIFPNPANDLLAIEFPDKYDASMVSVFDCAGSCLLNHKLTGTRMEVDVSSWSSGIYCVQITTDQSPIRRLIEVIR